jgi:mono/diheme cytochrome c family protein
MGRWLAVAMLFATACKEEEEPAPPEEDRVDVILGLEGEIASGTSLYDEHCAGCHGADGLGGVGTDLVEQLAILSEEDVVRTIVEGRGIMPAWGETQSDQEIADVVAYIYDAFGA